MAEVKHQYCRHCKFCYCAEENAFYCSIKDAYLKLNTVKVLNHCGLYEKGRYDALRGEKRYYSETKRLIDEEKAYFPPIKEEQTGNCLDLIGVMFEEWFNDLTRLTKRKLWSNYKIILDVCDQTEGIVHHLWVHYLIKDPVAFCNRFLSEVAPISKGKYTYKITDKRTGVHFTAHMNYDYPDYYILKSKPYIEIERVEE